MSSTIPTVTVPHNFAPRPYQLPLFRAMDSGFLRACVIWHRRAGKDKCLVNLVAKKMLERVGAYYYFFPTYKQGRKILWNGMDKDGFRFLSHFPGELLDGKPNDQEMLLRYRNDSLFQVIGTDNINSIVGTNPVGCIFSEYSLQDPVAWDFVRPILAENGGWAVFNYTPRGHNHGKQLFDMAERMDNWFTQKLTVDDTGAIAPDILEQEKREMFERTGSDALFMQEYYCSFDAPVQGSYYSKQMLDAEREGRITSVPWQPQLKVNTYWDLGIDDSMTIWFLQVVGQELHLIDYLENSGEGLLYYIKELGAKPYVYGEHFAPHDIQVRELGTGKSRLETARGLGINFRIAPNVGLDDGIDAVRTLLPRCWFDREKCERGLAALHDYQKEWDEKNKVYKNHPLHNWASHGADAKRILAVSFRQTSQSQQSNKEPTYDPVTGRRLD